MNIHLTGMVIVAVGLGCNLVALVANKAMPVRESAAIDAGLADERDRGDAPSSARDDVLPNPVIGSRS